MQVGVYKTSGGKDIVLLGGFSSETKAKLLSILKILTEEGLENFITRPVDKNSNPKLWEIKNEKMRLFYFQSNGAILITHIVENKQKNKTEKPDKRTATGRIKLMLENPEVHVAWV